jgi:hypothetical protein
VQLRFSRGLPSTPTIVFFYSFLHYFIPSLPSLHLLLKVGTSCCLTFLNLCSAGRFGYSSYLLCSYDFSVCIRFNSVGEYPPRSSPLGGRCGDREGRFVGFLCAIWLVRSCNRSSPFPQLIITHQFTRYDVGRRVDYPTYDGTWL